MLWLPIVTRGSGCDLLEVWRDHADEVRGHGIDSGHFIPEEAAIEPENGQSRPSKTTRDEP